MVFTMESLDPRDMQDRSNLIIIDGTIFKCPGIDMHTSPISKRSS